MLAVVFLIFGAFGVGFFLLFESQEKSEPKSFSAEDHDKLVALKRRTHNLSVQIFDFLAEWEKNKPESQGELGRLWGNKDFDSEAFGKAFAEAGERDHKYANEMSVRFAQEFSGRVVTIRNELAKAGLKSEKLDKVIADNLRLKSDIQSSAEEIQILADRINEAGEIAVEGAHLVKQRARTLASQMFDFLKQTQSVDPHLRTLSDIAAAGEHAGKSPKEINDDIQEQWSKELRFQEKTAIDFNQQFGHRLHEVRGQLKQLGYPTPKIDETLDSPYVRTWNIQWSCEELNSLAEKIQD